MLKIALILAAATAIALPLVDSFYQESPDPFTLQIANSIATTPVPNNCWTYTLLDNSNNSTTQQYTIDIDVNDPIKFTILTDMVLGYIGAGTFYWSITDMNTNKVVWVAPNVYGQNSFHLQTPIVFERGPNKPILKMSNFIIPSTQPNFTPIVDNAYVSLSLIGRKVFTN